MQCQEIILTKEMVEERQKKYDMIKDFLRDNPESHDDFVNYGMTFITKFVLQIYPKITDDVRNCKFNDTYHSVVKYGVWTLALGNAIKWAVKVLSKLYENTCLQFFYGSPSHFRNNSGFCEHVAVRIDTNKR